MKNREGKKKKINRLPKFIAFIKGTAALDWRISINRKYTHTYIYKPSLSVNINMYIYIASSSITDRSHKNVLLCVLRKMFPLK